MFGWFVGWLAGRVFRGITLAKFSSALSCACKYTRVGGEAGPTAPPAGHQTTLASPGSRDRGAAGEMRTAPRPSDTRGGLPKRWW